MNQSGKQTELDLRLLRVLMNSSKSLFELIKSDVNNYGLDLDTFQILEFLYNKGPHPIQKIGEKFAIPSGSVTYVVDKLEKKGLIRREPSPCDRRVIIAKLTDAGQSLFDDIFPRHTDSIANVFSVLTDEEKHQLTELLKKMGLNAADKLSG
ncbi:MarR family winged helix-turn-helix transcriptional regulator [Paenibacillus sepulcri]|uniref:MarR family transcriptional regulator n=1 Tax=Paenibacillus sepulcri TaxID=359917 RepID=A0ABS7C639_9BACL|nr:MarR family transcriptional regulator [Paenibacillus sepulcri]